MKTTLKRAFSLVEVLAAVSIIGVITFLALPNIIAVKQDSETNLAIARAEAINMSMVNYIQAYGRDNAKTTWTGKTNQQRYELLAAYLAFAPADFPDYMPTDYSVALPGTLGSISKVTLTGPGGVTITY